MSRVEYVLLCCYVTENLFYNIIATRIKTCNKECFTKKNVTIGEYFHMLLST